MTFPGLNWNAKDAFKNTPMVTRYNDTIMHDHVLMRKVALIQDGKIFKTAISNLPSPYKCQVRRKRSQGQVWAFNLEHKITSKLQTEFRPRLRMFERKLCLSIRLWVGSTQINPRTRFRAAFGAWTMNLSIALFAFRKCCKRINDDKKNTDKLKTNVTMWKVSLSDGHCQTFTAPQEGALLKPSNSSKETLSHQHLEGLQRAPKALNEAWFLFGICLLSFLFYRFSLALTFQKAAFHIFPCLLCLAKSEILWNLQQEGFDSLVQTLYDPHLWDNEMY